MARGEIERRHFLEWLVTLPLVLTLPGGLAWAARLRVQALRHWPEPDKTRLVFDLDAAPKFETRLLTAPDRILLVLEAAELERSLDQTFPGDPLVEAVQARRAGDAVEVTIRLRRICEVEAFPLQPNAAGKGHRVVLDVTPRLTSEEARHRRARDRERIARVRDSGDRIVVIDPGHGGEDPGTVWGRSLQEKDVALEVARRLASRLEAARGLRPVLTRDSDRFVPLVERREVARRYGAHVFLSIHVNAARARDARGAEIYFLSLKGALDRAAQELVDRENAADLVGGVPEARVDAPLVDILMGMTRDRTMHQSERLADLLLRRLGRVPGAAVRGVKQGPLAVLKSVDKPSVLVELGFFTNPRDRRLLADPESQDRFAAAMARGVESFLMAAPKG